MSAHKSKRQPASAKYRQRRRGVLRRAQAAAQVDALFVTKAADIRYLCGCTEGGNALLVGPSWAALFTSKMFKAPAEGECPGTEICVPKDGFYKDAAARLREHRLGALGIQEHDLTLSQHRSLKRATTRMRLVRVGNVVGDRRRVKDEEEIRLTRRAIRISDRAFRDLLSQGAKHFVGRTERELAAELDYGMRLAGADRQAFPSGTIVASGPNSASCHHMPGPRRVREAEPVLFDWGAEVEGYRSDITRVVFVGRVPDRFREIYELVLAAHDAAMAAIKPGVRCPTVDKIARDIIKDAGYGEEFRHGLGHGLGLEIHEEPRFAAKPKTGRGAALRKHMIMTVEPGVYLDGVGGVRIEDDVLVTADGHEQLTTTPRQLVRAILH